MVAGGKGLQFCYPDHDSGAWVMTAWSERQKQSYDS